SVHCSLFTEIKRRIKKVDFSLFGTFIDILKKIWHIIGVGGERDDKINATAGITGTAGDSRKNKRCSYQRI
uniref:hypothetical protein n=1 Tax=Paratractidigestivibacter sp. TaxID=2847316 RepID=UPI003AB1EF6D